MTYLASFLSAVSVVALLSAGPTAAQASFTDTQRHAIERMIRTYILNNPEIIVESVQSMGKRAQAAKQRRQRQALMELRQSLENDPGSHVGGNPNGDVTVIEFFDYSCSYCKRFLPNLVNLMRNDTKLRIVFKEHPILSRDSVMASRAALAARLQDRDL